MKKLFLVILSVLFVGNMQAQKLTVSDLNVEAGSTGELIIGIDGPAAVQAVQFTLVLPDGASVEMDGEDFIVDALLDSGDGIMPKRNSQVSANKKDDGSILIVAFNTKGVFSGETGDIVSISIEADASADGKVLACQLKDIKGGSLVDGAVVSAGEYSDVDFNITVGDATGINSISVNDPNAEVYNLNGQRVKSVKKGVYVVNGKKVAVK